LREESTLTKSAFARDFGISRSLLYYRHRLPEKDWRLKREIETVLHDHPSYGHKRLALHLRINRKRIRRVMKLFGMKPYRRRGRKWKKRGRDSVSFPNLLLAEFPRYPGHIWASDFTHIPFHGKTVYLATIVDLFTREIVGFSVLLTHSVQLVTQALLSAIHAHPPPAILHSDQGSEYAARDYVALAANIGVRISMSRKSSPWENGYQESFYSQFKVDLGDPNRFRRIGELVYAIYRTIHEYNHNRIHTILKMPPVMFAERHLQRSSQLLEAVS